MEHKKRLAWFILARVVLVSLFLAATLVVNAKEPGDSASRALFVGSIKIIVTTYLFSIFSLIVLRLSSGFTRSLTYLQIVWDVLFVTVLLLMTGGIGSPFSILYLLAITNASVLLARKDAFYTASLCSILYGSMLNLLYYRIIPPLQVYYLPPVQYDTSYIFYIAFLNILAFFLVAFLTGSLAERVRQSESALQDKVIDYEELEQLHSAIVSNLTSGLVMINREGRIRVFNRYAETITGMTQTEAYDRPLGEVIPELASYANGSEAVKRGEFLFRTKEGEAITLGLSTTPLHDKDGAHVGLVINFQDLTQVKHMENELKRADRLAAIGELSAGIAHEIRNPLAAISGSVQLIASSAKIADSDRKLLEIVLRETDRLNKLIKDFLSYARPVVPVKTAVHARTFIADLQVLFATDVRFRSVMVEQIVPEDLFLLIDIDQFNQVLWNLLANAAEAMDGEGVVRIELFGPTSWLDAAGKDRIVRITVSDAGCGMDGEQLKRLFEPFYTTKKNGTGLGLATVYRIVEAHGGNVQVSSKKGEGTTVTISLPE